MSAPYVALVDAGPMGSRSSVTVEIERGSLDSLPGDPTSRLRLGHLELDVPPERAESQPLASTRSDSRPVTLHDPRIGDGHPLRMSEDVRGIRPDVLRGPLDHLFGDGCAHGRASSCWTTGSAPAMTVARRAYAASFSTRIRSTAAASAGASALVGPAKPEAGPALGRIEVRGRRDRTDARDGQPPPDAVVGLPVDDLLERRQPAGHALRRGPDAATPAGRRLLDRDRALPSRPQGGRGQVRPDHRWVGGQCRLDVEGEIGLGDVEPALARSRPASEPRGPG